MSRPFTVLACEQRSPEWFAARAGRLTASDAHDAITMGKNNYELANRRDLRMRLVLERLTGSPAMDSYENDDMRRGRELEPDARLAYSAEMGVLVEQTGFCQHNEIAIGCSLDGHLDEFEGIVEIKVPREANHFECWKTQAVPEKHLAQLAHALWITDASYVDYVSYGGPNFPEDMRLAIIRIPRAKLDLKVHEQKALAFLAEVQRDVEAAGTLRGAFAKMREAVSA